MDLLVFSDSHGHAGEMREVLMRARTDAVFHLGDGVRDAEALPLGNTPLYAVRGNCDLFEERPEEIVMALGGHVILAVHGHRDYVKSGTGTLIRHAVAVGADVVLFGHTHLAQAEYLPAGTPYVGGTLPHALYLCNPGSIGQNADGKGKSFGRLLLQGKDVLFSIGRV
jgi:putative phosphoesterase